jgi:multimeric flavodoxin WrbA
MKILEISSSPKRDGKSNTELLLNHLVRGMREGGGEVRIINLREKNIKTCVGCFTCWTKTPGRCIHMDDMNQELLSLMPASDLVIYATPLYNRAMNATMSNFRERLLPLSQPFSEKRDGKYARKLRKKLPPAVWLSVCGHPDAAEFEALSQFLKHTHHPDTPIVAEIYRTSSEALKHPVFRNKLKDILEASIQAGRELVESLEISKGTLGRIGQPLNNPQSLFVIGNNMWQSCINENVTLEEFFEKGMMPRPDSVEAFMAISVYGFNPEAIGERKVTVQFKFSGEVEASCYFAIEKGNIRSSAGTCDNYDIAIETPFELWMDIMSGKADGQEMFMQGRYRVDGDLAMMPNLFKKGGRS